MPCTLFGPGCSGGYLPLNFFGDFLKVMFRGGGLYLVCVVCSSSDVTVKLTKLRLLDLCHGYYQTRETETERQRG